MTMSSDHSSFCTEKSGCSFDQVPSNGTHKVKYHPDAQWDLHMDVEHKSIDLSLILPHYRARNQPINHRMSMFVGGDSAPIKLRVCRNMPRSKFYLEVQAETSDVTVWLPSDFKGQIHHSGRASFSAGFVNRIMRNARLNGTTCTEIPGEDGVVVHTQGHVLFRMWDVHTSTPESPRKESIKRLLGCSRKSPEMAVDWDFLVKE